MSIIVAQAFGDEAWIASDSLAGCHDSSFRPDDIESGPKFFVEGTTALCMSGYLSHLRKAKSGFRPLIGSPEKLSDRLEKFFREKNLVTEGEIPEWHGSALIVRPSGVWEIGSDFTVVKRPRKTPYFIGAGRKSAYGAYEGLRLSDGLAEMGRDEVLWIMVSAAISGDKSCGGKIHMKQLVKE